jgi:hypothetical protein
MGAAGNAALSRDPKARSPASNFSWSLREEATFRNFWEKTMGEILTIDERRDVENVQAANLYDVRDTHA